MVDLFGNEVTDSVTKSNNWTENVGWESLADGKSGNIELERSYL